MKISFLTLILLTAVILPMQAFALTCTSGEIGNDDYIRTRFNEASIDFQVHETFFTVRESKYVGTSDNMSIDIPEHRARMKSEGETFRAKVSAEITYIGADVILSLKINGFQVAKGRRLYCH